jgi:16S rRNA (uracil1498-N3)-methyltransferase
VRNFIISSDQIDGNKIRCSASEQKHITTVLRMQQGDQVRFLDDNGNYYIATLQYVDENKISAEIINQGFNPPSSPSVTLFQALIKPSKMGLVMQKTAEIGVDQIVPMVTDRSIINLKPSTHIQKNTRWQRIANEATKQCRRLRFPKILQIQSFTECLLSVGGFDEAIILYENEKVRSIQSVLRGFGSLDSVAVLVGPEGGFTNQENEAALAENCVPVSLGTNILRTETAAIVAAALVVYELRTGEGN